MCDTRDSVNFVIQARSAKLRNRLRDRYGDISQNSRLCPKLSSFSTERFLYFIRNMSIIWHSINNRTSTSPNSAVRLSCRIAGVRGFMRNALLFSLKIKEKNKERKTRTLADFVRTIFAWLYFKSNYSLKGITQL